MQLRQVKNQFCQSDQKNPINYPDPTFYKQIAKNKKEDTYTGMFDIPKYSTAPAKQINEQKKITPSLLVV